MEIVLFEVEHLLTGSLESDTTFINSGRRNVEPMVWYKV